MSSASTGFWSALGAVVGGVAGATAGHYAAQYRPRLRYARAVRARGDQEIEDAMVVGGAAGAVVGAFLGGTIAGGDPKQLR
jgi:outer membrane lipoprotein SlyB